MGSARFATERQLLRSVRGNPRISNAAIFHAERILYRYALAKTRAFELTDAPDKADFVAACHRLRHDRPVDVGGQLSCRTAGSKRG